MEKIKKHNMPVAIYHVIEKYIQKMKEKGWDKELKDDSYIGVLYLETPEVMQEFVEELILVYRKLSRIERRDFLIPEKGKYLNSQCVISRPLSIAQQEIAGYATEYAFAYDWNSIIENEWKDYNEDQCKWFDRIGTPAGSYLCPRIGKKAFPLHMRSLPYFFFKEELDNITRCPSYHLYKLQRSNTVRLKSRRTASGFDKKGGAREIIVKSIAEHDHFQSVSTLLECGVFGEMILHG